MQAGKTYHFSKITLVKVIININVNDIKSQKWHTDHGHFCVKIKATQIHIAHVDKYILLSYDQLHE